MIHEGGGYQVVMNVVAKYLTVQWYSQVRLNASRYVLFLLRIFAYHCKNLQNLRQLHIFHIKNPFLKKRGKMHEKERKKWFLSEKLCAAVERILVKDLL